MQIPLKTMFVAASLVAASSAYAGDVYFQPLTASNTNSDAASFNNAPFKLPAHFSQQLVASRSSLNAIMNGAFPATFGNWDMLDFGGDNKQYIFIPHEVGDGAGVTRINRDVPNLEPTVLLEGVAGDAFDMNPADGWDKLTDNYGGVDPAHVTPAGTLVVAEEWAGAGRMFELMNPTTATDKYNADWRWLSNIPSVSHEGVQFDSAGNLYFIDEDSSGSIYKFVPSTYGDYSMGQVFVLRVIGDSNDRATGAAEWVPLTDAYNNAITAANPFDFTSRGGRAAADEVGANGYCRPEDMTIGKLANGNEVLSFSATCTYNVYSVELVSDHNAVIREYASAYVTPDTIGHNPVGQASGANYGLSSPDNLATDTAGNIFIVEDQNPGDIWMSVDADNNGVAEAVAMFASLGDYGSEPTGFKNDPRDPFTWYVHVQHPSKQGNNDSLWMIKHDVTESCDCQAANNHGQYVSCVAHATRKLGIKGSVKDALMQVAASSQCGK